MHYEEIFNAVKQNDAKKVFALIEADGELLNISDSNVITPLTIAFAYGHRELALALIERGANVFSMNHSKKWGMQYIVEKDGLTESERNQFIDAVIASGVCDQQIFHALWRRDVSQVKTILDANPELASARLADPDGESGFYNQLPWCGLTPLHYAVIAGDEPMCRALLDAGAEVDAIPHGQKPDSRHTPMYLVPDGCESIAELLVEHGADVDHSVSYLTGGSDSMRKVIVAHGAGGTPLLAALTIGDVETAIELIRADVSVIHDRLSDTRIDSPLHMAMKINSEQVVDLLIESGMDIDTPNSYGHTALSLAPENYCSLEMIKFLVKRGADVHVGDDSTIFAAIWQHAYGHWDYEAVIRFLASQGSRPRGLWHCAQGGNLKAVELLIELGADVNETDELVFFRSLAKAQGFTAIDYCTGVAGEHQHPEIEALLRKHGAKSKSELNL